MFRREHLGLQAARTSAQFNSLDKQTQHILSAILQIHDNIGSKVSQQINKEITGITITLSQILSRLGPTSQEPHKLHLQNRHAILDAICNREDIPHPKAQEVIAGIELLNVSEFSEQRLRNKVQTTILEYLKYEEMTNRFEDVTEAHPETFEWAFSAPAEEQSWSDLSRWLKEGDGVYWVSGKAGSGKSTFMKHLVDDEQKRLHKLLRIWARDSPLCIATFFFWNGGTSLQKSQSGFLRALLFQILNEYREQYPELIPFVFPMEWLTLYSREIAWSNGEHEWTLSFPIIWKVAHLKKVLRSVSNQTIMPLKICFVIDGLDEFDADDDEYEALGAFFQDITSSKNVKVCLSSRPWVVFEDLFSGSPNLKLQNLIYRDIEKYIHDKFYQNNAFQKLISRDSAAARGLLAEIVEKADGVFLWVKLVVRTLLNGLRNRDDLSDLWEQLRRLPRELKPLYNHLFGLIEPYERWASQAIQILRCNRDLCNAPSDRFKLNQSVGPITISEFLFAMSVNLPISSIDNMTRREFQLKCEDMKLRLTARCAGFLEVSSVPGTSVMGPTSLINYFHRTAKDFLESDEIWAKLISETEGTDFDSSVALMRSYLWYIKTQIVFSAELAENFIYKDVEAAPQAVAFMACAVRADPHVPSRGMQTNLIDQLNDLICNYDKGGNWLYSLVPHLQGRCTLLEISTLLGLKGYLRDKFTNLHESQLKSTATSLLRFVLSNVTVSNFLFRDVEILSLLLESVSNGGSSYREISNTLQAAQHRLLQFRKCSGDLFQSELHCIQSLESRIEEFLHPMQSSLGPQSSPTKRQAEEIEDIDSVALHSKTRKRLDNGPWQEIPDQTRLLR